MCNLVKPSFNLFKSAHVDSELSQQACLCGFLLKFDDALLAAIRPVLMNAYFETAPLLLFKKAQS